MATGPDYIHEPIRKLAVPLEGLTPYARNARRGDLGAIMDSLDTHGQYKPITVRAKTNEVLAGNHTLAAAAELGWDQIAVTFVDVDDDTAARIVLVDNRTADMGTYDDAALADLLKQVAEDDAGLAGTGYDEDDLKLLLEAMNEATWEDEDLQDVLDEADESAWPVLHIKVDPDTEQRFRDVEGDTVEEKFLRLMHLAEV